MAIATAISGTGYTLSDGTADTTGDFLTYAVSLWLAGMAIVWHPRTRRPIKRWDNQSR